MMTLMDSMAKLRRNIQQLQDNMAGIQTEVMSHTDQIRDIKEQGSTVMRPSYAAMTQKSSNGLPASMAQMANSTSVIGADMVASAIQQINSEAHKPLQRSGPMGGLLAAPVKKRQQTRGLPGTSEGPSSLKAGPEVFHIQLTNIHPDIGIDQLKKYINDKDNSIDPVDVKDTSSSGWETKRFLVTLKSSEFDKVMTGDFWPSRIYYKQWYKARPKPSPGTLEDKATASAAKP